MRQWMLTAVLFFAVLFQGSVTTIPLSLIFLVVLFCIYQNELIFLAAFVSGIFLDILLVQPIGETSIFFILFLFLIFLYQRKFEIASYYFIFLSLFLGTIVYQVLFGTENIVVTAFISGILGIGIFLFLQYNGLMPIKKSIDL
jgi:cell shape-determining protein MreD